MSLKARILYDFEGDTENGELVINEGEEVIVLNQDIGDGWWEGQRPNGEVGLFPESYCEIIADGVSDGYGDGAMQEDNFQQEAEPYQNDHDVGGAGDGYDKWDDEEEDWEAQQRQQDEEGYGEHPADGGRHDSASPGSRSGNFGRAGTVRKNINRFSPFVKTGTESFVLGAATVKSNISDHLNVPIIVSPEGTPMWEPNPEAHTVTVQEPSKQKKFKGIKTFTAYQVVPSSTQRAVSRRYKHYDWLHSRLEEKFTLNSVPPLPDKQYYGRYGEEFVAKRQEKLQRWSNRIARHPVISRSEVVNHFFLCDDTGSQWKAGKRRAEKDDLVGGALFRTFVHPGVTVEVDQAEAHVEAFGSFLKAMRASLTKMRVKFIDHCNQMSGPFMAEFNKMASVINGLATNFEMEREEYTSILNNAIGFTAKTYHEIAEMHAEQPRNDMLPCLDVIKEYLGLIFTFPDMVQIHRGASSKVHDCDKMKEEGRIDITDAADIVARSETISAAVLAEIYHFQHERVVDFREMMKLFLAEQIKFYEEIVDKLKLAIERYDESTNL